MNTTIQTTTKPTRRSALDFSAAAAAAIVAGLTTAASATPNPDAELLAACAEFVDLDRQYRALCDSYGAEDVPDDAAAPLERRIVFVVDRMCALRATTVEGFRARGASLVHYMPEIAKDGQEYINDRVLAALLRDLVAGGAEV
jgi:hypothetical protein